MHRPAACLPMSPHSNCTIAEAEHIEQPPAASHASDPVLTRSRLRSRDLCVSLRVSAPTVLFPPLTALEVCGTHIEGAVLIVELRPSMKEPGLLKTGAEDCRLRREARQKAAQEEERRRQEAIKAEKRAAAELAARNRHLMWGQAMADVKLTAAKRQSTAAAAKLAEKETEAVLERWHKASDASEKATLADELQQLQLRVDDAKKAQVAAEKKAALAAAGEAKALKAKQTAERQLGQKTTGMFTQAQFLRGVLRAKTCADMYQEAQAEEEPEAAPEEEPEVDFGPIDKLEVAPTVRRLQEVLGHMEQWAVIGARPRDIELCTECCEHIAKLCATSKKSRAAAANAGVFEQLANCMLRYQDEEMGIVTALFRAVWKASQVLTKKAEAEGLQEKGSDCLFGVVKTLQSTSLPAFATIHAVTQNNRETTTKLLRAGGRVDWLSEDSNVVAPDQEKGAWPFTKK